MVAHIPEILRQGNSCNKNRVLQDTVQKGILCLYIIISMYINQIIWVYILMETDNRSNSFFLLMSPLSFFFFCCCCLFLLTHLIFVYEPLRFILHSHAFLWRDTAMSLMLLFLSLKSWTKTPLTVKCLLPFQTTRIQEWEKVVFYLNYLTTVYKKEL